MEKGDNKVINPTLSNYNTGIGLYAVNFDFCSGKGAIYTVSKCSSSFVIRFWPKSSGYLKPIERAGEDNLRISIRPSNDISA